MPTDSLENFISGKNKDIFVVCDTVDEIEEALQNYEPPATRYGLDWTDSSTNRNDMI